jgi:hypothetical protein
MTKKIFFFVKNQEFKYIQYHLLLDSVSVEQLNIDK